MPDLSDTVAKCRMGTAKKFYTSIASLSHTNKWSGIDIPFLQQQQNAHLGGPGVGCIYAAAGGLLSASFCVSAAPFGIVSCACSV